MATDVLLDFNNGHWLVLQAEAVKVEASDLMIDSSDRREGAGKFRRALVHDFGDALALNYGGDYPGGVRIYGPLRLSGPIDQAGTMRLTGPLFLGGVVEITPKSDLRGSGLGTVAVKGGLSFQQRVAKAEGGSKVATFDLGALIDSLRAQIGELRARVSALEEG